MIAASRLFLISILTPLLILSIPTWADDSPSEVNDLLKKLSTSLRQDNYRGLFTYEMGGVLDTYKIVHRVENGVEYERLFKLNGLQKEVLRSGRHSDCASRGDKLMQLLAMDLNDSGQVASANESNYQFSIKETKRVAGRSAIVLQVIPRDQFRYGYFFGLDESSGLPLQILVVGTDGQVLERFQFVELEVGDDVAESELFPSQEEYHHAAHESAQCDDDWVEEKSPWRLSWLPSGFEYTGHKRTRHNDVMLSYTDGLASFSVFVGPNESRPRVQGKAQLGSTVAALSQHVWNEQMFCVTVVGEIPLTTAVQVANSVELR